MLGSLFAAPIMGGLYVPNKYEKVPAVISKIEYRYRSTNVWIDYIYDDKKYEEVEYNKSGFMWTEGKKIDVYVDSSNPEKVKGMSWGGRIYQIIVFILFVIYASVSSKNEDKDETGKDKKRKKKKIKNENCEK